MTDGPEIREIAAQPAAVSHHQTEADGIADVVDSGFPKLFARIGELGVYPAGAPFIRYLETGERMSLELGVPVEAAADLDGTPAGELPAGRAAVLTHVGPYSGLRDACERLFAWVSEHGEEPAGPFWEAYVTDPSSEPDSSQWVTEIVQPIR